jgi:hypothetical protein
MSHRALLVAFLLAIGCNDDTQATDAQDAATGGAAGSAGGSGSAGSGGLSSCLAPGNQISISIEPSPLDGGIGAWDATGVVTAAATKNSFVIDSCAPTTGCGSSLTSVTLEPAAIDVGLQVGAYVRVRYEASPYNTGLIQAKLSVANVPSWDGKPNPVSTAEAWNFFAVEGALQHPDTPFEVSSAALDCAPPPEGHGKSYTVMFRASADDPWTTLEQDESATLTVDGRQWKIAVVRAFELYGFDRPNPFAWWASAHP